MILEVEDLHTYYGHSHVLQGVSLKVNAGEILGVLGRNGMGKTTLMHSIAGILRPRRGTVNFGGKPLHGLRAERVSAAGISLVPQGHRIFPSLTVRENLSVAYRRSRDSLAPWTIADVYDRFSVLGERSNVRAGALSGGQQQMLAMGRSLVQNSKLILMDEPTEGLDPHTVARIGGVIDELRERKTSAILVEQKVDFALARVDRAVIIGRGQVVEESNSPETLRRDVERLRRLLGVGNE